MFVVYCLLLTGTVAEAVFQGHFYKGDQVLRIYPTTQNQVRNVLTVRRAPGLEKLDAWMPTFRPHHPADFYAKRKELPILKKFLNDRNISYSILVGNVTDSIFKQRTLKKRNRFRNGKYDYEHYHPLNEIHEELKNLHKKYADTTELIDLGKSYENRTMLAIKIMGRKKKKNKKMFFIDCGTHAREWLSPATCMWFIKQILEEYNNRTVHQRMCNRISWVIIPVLNVDGYVHSWSESGRFWRKNRKPNKGSSCYGTDLNRNWAYKWDGIGSVKNPCQSSYRGEAPFSEIETRNVAKFLYKNRCNLLGYIGFHCYSQFWMTPWGYKKDHPEHYSEMKRIADIAVKAIEDAGQGSKFAEPGPSSEIIYANIGSAKDWTYGVLNIQYSYGVELRPHYNGSHGFLIPPDQIKPSGVETLAAVKAISREINLYEGRRVLNKAHLGLKLNEVHVGHNGHD